jgi:hypothetical protein
MYLALALEEFSIEASEAFCHLSLDFATIIVKIYGALEVLCGAACFRIFVPGCVP